VKRQSIIQIAFFSFVLPMVGYADSISWNVSSYDYINQTSGAPPSWRNWLRGIYNPQTQMTEYFMADNSQGSGIYSGTVWGYNAATNKFVELWSPRAGPGDDCHGFANYSSPAAPMARHPYAATYDTVDNTTWMIGGVCQGDRPMDTWEFSDTGTSNSGSWSQHITAHFPSTSGGADSFGLAYDAKDDAVFAVGGFNAAGNIMNITSVYCKRVDPQISGRNIGCAVANDWNTLTTSGAFPPTAGEVLFWSQTLNKLVSYGGQTSGGVGVNTVWVYEPSTQAWTQESPTGVAPSNANGYAYGTEDTSRGRFVATYDGTKAFELNLNSWVWATITYSAGAGPDGSIGPGNEVALLTYDVANDKFIGAEPHNGSYYNWEIGTPSSQSSNPLAWQQLTGETGNTPNLTVFTNTVWDSQHQMLLFAAKNTTSIYFDGIWTFNPATLAWTNLWLDSDSSDCPGDRTNAPNHRHTYNQFTWDSKRNQSYITSGSCHFGLLYDWYAFTHGGTSGSGAWTQFSIPATNPGVRQDSQMVYMPNVDRVLLYGGLANASAIPDAWEYNPNANTWRQVCSNCSPGGRVDGALVYDEASGKVVLWGGTAAYTTPALASTFLYDPTAKPADQCDNTCFAAANPVQEAPPAAAPCFGYDHQRQRVVVYGNTGDSVYAYTTGSNTWSSLGVGGTPPGRDLGGGNGNQDSFCGYDSKNDWFLLFNGSSGAAPFNVYGINFGSSAPPSVAVTVNPTSVGLNLGGTQSFTATVTGNANTAVTWSVQEAGGGAIDQSGNYTAPGTPGTYHVVATSQADSTKSASATLVVTVPPPSTITMPIEVIGADGLVESVTFSISNPSVIDHLWVRVHALDYPDKGSVQINGGAWIPLDNNTVQVADPAKSFGGIGGALSVLEFTLPVQSGALVSGNNTLSFRFNGTDGVSSGFRILAFNFYQGSTAILPNSLFAMDQPSTWTAPPGADPVHGNALFWTAQLEDSPLTHRVIGASCRSCHTNDGRDLQYFSFSNQSIIARSQFHGLSAQNGADIAAFVRTLPVAPAGRPWNPPFQPGPGTDSLPVNQWAAGQSFGAVLATDSAMLSSLFPGGKVTSAPLATTSTLDLRELPINLLLPDWNHWLPRTAPGDIPGAGANFAASNLSVIYQQLRTTLTAQSASASTIAGIATTFQNWSAARKQFLAAMPTPSDPASSEQAYAVALWQLMKSWELMHEFNLEGYGTTLYGSSAESRSWFIDAAAAAAPDALGIPRGSQGLRGGGVIQIYLSMAWLHLQAILTPNRTGAGFMNWSLAWTEFRDLTSVTGIPSAMRFVSLFTKAGQITDNGIGPDQTTSQGWAPDTLYDLSRLVSSAFDPLWAQTAGGVRTALLENLTHLWLGKSQSYTRDQYLAGGHLQNNETPIDNTPDGRWVDKMWYSIPRLAQLGVSNGQTAAVIAWMKTLWPQVAWDTLQINPTVGVQSPLLNVQVYPNPWRSDKHAGHPSITFAGLTTGTTIKIFTVAGHHVKELHADTGSLPWDLTNDAGDKVASGVYVYLITDGAGDKVKGKVAVIK